MLHIEINVFFLKIIHGGCYDLLELQLLKVKNITSYLQALIAVLNLESKQTACGVPNSGPLTSTFIFYF